MKDSGLIFSTGMSKCIGDVPLSHFSLDINEGTNVFLRRCSWHPTSQSCNCYLSYSLQTMRNKFYLLATPLRTLAYNCVQPKSIASVFLNVLSCVA